MADGVVQNVRICAGRRGRGRVRAGLSGRDGVSLAGVEELAAEPAVLVQAAAGTSIRLFASSRPILTEVKPADRDEPLDRRGCTVVAGGIEQHRPAGSPVRAGGE